MTRSAVSARGELAIAAILSGMDDASAAAQAGVRRETLNRWRNHDPRFIAELNRRRAELWSANAEALRALLPKTVCALRECLEAEDARTRLRAAELILQSIPPQLIVPPPEEIAPQDPDGAFDQIRRKNIERRRANMLRRSETSAQSQDLRLMEEAESKLLAEGEAFLDRWRSLHA